MNSIQSASTSTVIFSDLLFHIFIINASEQFFSIFDWIRWSPSTRNRSSVIFARKQNESERFGSETIERATTMDKSLFFSSWASVLVTDNESLSDCCFCCCSVMTKLYITVNQMEHYCCCSQTSQQHMGTQHTYYFRQSKSVIFVIALIYQQLWFASRFIFIISSGSALNWVAKSQFTIHSSTVNRISENICHSIN